VAARAALALHTIVIAEGRAVTFIGEFRARIRRKGDDTDAARALNAESADRSKGGRPMRFFDWFQFVRTSWKKEDGQTMAEYGVVLAVITLGIVATLGLLSGGINNALNSVISFL
jgi:Flp pilus assembly pilin Flp